MRAIGYVRVSTEEQAAEGVSIAAQIEKIRLWSELNDRELEVFVDSGISGTKRNRKYLNEALGQLGEGVALVVYDMSRLSRSTKDMLEIAELIDKKGADLVSLTEKIDTSTASGKMVFRMMAVLNEYQRDQISEKTSSALQYKKLQGRRAGNLPYGYDVADDGDTLIRNEQEQFVIKKVCNLSESGLGSTKIARILESEGVVSRSGKPLNKTQVKRIIDNGLNRLAEAA